MGRQVSSNRKSFNEEGLVSIRAKTWVGIPSSAGPAGVHRPIQSPATHASSALAIWHNFAQCERASESRVQLTAGLRTAPYEPEKFYQDKTQNVISLDMIYVLTNYLALNFEPQCRDRFGSQGIPQKF